MLPLIMAGASLAGSLYNIHSQGQANKAAMNAAEENRGFQERMSSTAHQRQVADMKAAGLNPVLSAGGSGSSTPSGGMPSLTAPAIQTPDPIPALNLRETQLNNIASRANLNAQTAATIQQTKRNELSAQMRSDFYKGYDWSKKQLKDPKNYIFDWSKQKVIQFNQGEK